ncbi:Helix-turn-helix [Persephonella hydrogeniphila]|uniref:Helix-turn-helix n=1 Tax=Persephonella hydrogeniphila TaxID=198703 RepID=A0A285NFJ1_9AQUI|nr:helix-turn-helix transcriptional regulator [Persephonella hydrogeniphila]SNZ08274.1 Helix-turn-helix [Persephonella hydrogeniphila]
MKTIDIQTQVKKYGRLNFIKGELLKRGLTLKQFAEILGISESFLYQMLHKDAKSRRVARQIEEFLEVPEGSLFPYVLEPVENSREKSNEKPVVKPDKQRRAEQ